MSSNDYYKIEKVIKFLEENYKKQPCLEDLSRELNLSPFHLQKLFKRWAGISPKKFLQILTLENVKASLNQSNSLTDATYDSGLSSISRTHELFVNIEAVTPAEYKRKGKDLEIFYGFHQTPFGKCLIAVTERGICNLRFIINDDEDLEIRLLEHEWKNAALMRNQKKTQIYIDSIFSKQHNKKVSLYLKGTNFQVKVWKALIEIPEGTLVTYSQIARKIGQPAANRAVGNAIGKNKVSFLIPCHRVIRKSGIIGNYRWGKERKKAIIAWEKAQN